MTRRLEKFTNVVDNTEEAPQNAYTGIALDFNDSLKSSVNNSVIKMSTPVLGNNLNDSSTDSTFRSTSEQRQD